MPRLLTDQLTRLGLQVGDVVMVHSSFKSLGISDPEDVVKALLEVLGPRGTLMMPALSYVQKPAEFHDNRLTPGCVGYLPEYFRTRPGTRRSLHPTHSVCAVGQDVPRMLNTHSGDNTPCGRNSPFRLLIEQKGKILMLGCGLKPNTTMHAIEELVAPPYLYGPELAYTLVDESGKVFQKSYVTHGFAGYVQRYDRVAELLDEPNLRMGLVGNGLSHLIDAEALCRSSERKMRDNPFFFVDLETA